MGGMGREGWGRLEDCVGSDRTPCQNVIFYYSKRNSRTPVKIDYRFPHLLLKSM